MPSFDDLKRINKANSIINRSNLNMGLRPMYLELAEDEPETLESASFASKVDDSLRTAKDNQVITAEEYYSNRSSFLDDSYYEEDLDEDLYQDDYYEEEYSEDLERAQYQPNHFFDAAQLNSKPLFESYPAAVAPQQTNTLPFAKTVMLTSFAVIISVYFIFAFKPVSTATESKQATQEETKIQKLTKVVNSTEPRSLIITSGDFGAKSEAEAYQEDLKAKLGVPLKLVKRGASYSVQIGPAYADHDDALIVFDELSRYSVENLSIKIAS